MQDESRLRKTSPHRYWSIDQQHEEDCLPDSMSLPLQKQHHLQYQQDQQLVILHTCSADRKWLPKGCHAYRENPMGLEDIVQYPQSRHARLNYNWPKMY